MTDEEYAPFPNDAEMIALEEFLVGLGAKAKSESSKETYERAARTAKNARLGHRALHDRYLIETTEYKRQLGQQGEKT